MREREERGIVGHALYVDRTRTWTMPPSSPREPTNDACAQKRMNDLVRPVGRVDIEAKKENDAVFVCL